MGTKTVLIVNSKGGAGKSTLSTSLATYYAGCGLRTALFDLDRQMSSMRWLQRRPDSAAEIIGVTGWAHHGSNRLERVVMDPPPQLERRDLVTLVARADAVVVPVLPSPIDTEAATDFVRGLLIETGVRTSRKPVAVIANRTRTNDGIYDPLREFLVSLNVPFVANLGDSDSYIEASQRGLGIFELNPRTVAVEIAQWQPLLDWLDYHLETGRVSSPANCPPRRQQPVLRAIT